MYLKWSKLSCVLLAVFGISISTVIAMTPSGSDNSQTTEAYRVAVEDLLDNIGKPPGYGSFNDFSSLQKTLTALEQRLGVDKQQQQKAADDVNAISYGKQAALAAIKAADKKVAEYQKYSPKNDRGATDSEKKLYEDAKEEHLKALKDFKNAQRAAKTTTPAEIKAAQDKLHKLNDEVLVNQKVLDTLTKLSKNADFVRVYDRVAAIEAVANTVWVPDDGTVERTPRNEFLPKLEAAIKFMKANGLTTGDIPTLEQLKDADSNRGLLLDYWKETAKQLQDITPAMKIAVGNSLTSGDASPVSTYLQSHTGEFQEALSLDVNPTELTINNLESKYNPNTEATESYKTLETRYEQMFKQYQEQEQETSLDTSNSASVNKLITMKEQLNIVGVTLKRTAEKLNKSIESAPTTKPTTLKGMRQVRALQIQMSSDVEPAKQMMPILIESENTNIELEATKPGSNAKALLDNAFALFESEAENLRNAHSQAEEDVAEYESKLKGLAVGDRNYDTLKRLLAIAERKATKTKSENKLTKKLIDSYESVFKTLAAKQADNSPEAKLANKLAEEVTTSNTPSDMMKNAYQKAFGKEGGSEVSNLIAKIQGAQVSLKDNNGNLSTADKAKYKTALDDLLNPENIQLITDANNENTSILPKVESIVSDIATHAGSTRGVLKQFLDWVTSKASKRSQSLEGILAEAGQRTAISVGQPEAKITPTGSDNSGTTVIIVSSDPPGDPNTTPKTVDTSGAHGGADGGSDGGRDGGRDDGRNPPKGVDVDPPPTEDGE